MADSPPEQRDARERRFVVHRVPQRRLQRLQPVERKEILFVVTEEEPSAEDRAQR
jgi:hypothetical protein